MQEQPNSTGGFQNRDSYHSRLNSNMSIDRFAIRSNSPTINHKISLIDAMDIQIPDRRSDLYQSLLGQQRQSSNYKRSSNVSRGEVFSRGSGVLEHEIAEQDNNLVSQKFIHQCNCDKQCHGEHCNCYLHPNELCVIGLCCQNCVKSKNQFLSRESDLPPRNGCFCKNIKCLKMYCSCYRHGKKCIQSVCRCEGCENHTDGLIDKKKRKYQGELTKDNGNLADNNTKRHNYHFIGKQGKNFIDTRIYSFVNCSCKKSHCLKKYCSCFLNNKSCGQACACQDCHNKYQQQDHQEQANRKARYARHDDEQHQEEHHDDLNQIDQFLEQQENFQKQELNQNMEFQPVNFENCGK